MRTVVNWPCQILHRLWWVPLWNRSTILTCPIAWAIRRFPAFDRWYSKD